MRRAAQPDDDRRRDLMDDDRHPNPQVLTPILHADDCGLTPGITAGIIACYDRGLLRRTSVIVNGSGWDAAVAALRTRPGLEPVLHLNLFEGAPLSAPSEIDLLVDRRGRFNRSFGALWALGYGPSARRLRRQIRLEVERQLERFVGAFGEARTIAVDGHVHYHVLPAVCDELMTLAAAYRVGAVRLPRELFRWRPLAGAGRPPLLNAGKNAALRLLCRRARPRFEAGGLHTSDAFIGVLDTGRMTLEGVRASLAQLRSTGTAGTVEILFHPGRARPDEGATWDDRPRLRSVYLSPDRDREAELLCSTALAAVLREYSGAADSGPSPVTDEATR
jgi:predicted glycoside hydrolase/deacetylase ChbG (UPF0249 family)